MSDTKDWNRLGDGALPDEGKVGKQALGAAEIEALPEREQDKTENDQPQEPNLSQDATMTDDATRVDNTPARDATHLLDTLTALAEKATAGPWTTAIESGSNWALVMHAQGDYMFPMARMFGGPDAEARNAAFVAACDPQTILSLCALARQWIESRTPSPAGEAPDLDEHRFFPRDLPAASVPTGEPIRNSPKVGETGCTCATSAPTVPVYRDAQTHLTSCPFWHAHHWEKETVGWIEAYSELQGKLNDLAADLSRTRRALEALQEAARKYVEVCERRVKVQSAGERITADIGTVLREVEDAYQRLRSLVETASVGQTNIVRTLGEEDSFTP